jgi:hypothetical protein
MFVTPAIFWPCSAPKRLENPAHLLLPAARRFIVRLDAAGHDLRAAPDRQRRNSARGNYQGKA